MSILAEVRKLIDGKVVMTKEHGETTSYILTGDIAMQVCYASLTTKGEQGVNDLARLEIKDIQSQNVVFALQGDFETVLTQFKQWLRRMTGVVSRRGMIYNVR